jgi:hypothetical protein
MDATAQPQVQQFRQILLWPLRLMPFSGDAPPWQQLQSLPGSPWAVVDDEYTGDSGQFHERHYNEFVSFLPYVQRFLYGEGRTQRAQAQKDGLDGASPMHVLRRTDVAAVRLVARRGEAPQLLSIVHIDLYFFYDVDLVFLNVEVAGGPMPLAVAQELLYRFGRAYPAGWSDDGQALHGMHSVEWLDAQGAVLAASDSQVRDDFLAFVSEHRAPRFSAHWAWLLQPLVSDHSPQPGALRYRQIEYYRMPVMGYLAVDDPTALTRSDFVRLGLVTGVVDDMLPPTDAPGHVPDSANTELPFAEHHLADFEHHHCYDRFWQRGGAAPHTRYLCCGHALVVVGRADSAYFTGRDRGVLAQFRHQHFLLFLIAHFQKAALLMFSERLVEALRRLDVRNPDSVREFKRTIRRSFEGFLRFTHRYWFHAISEQPQIRALSRLCGTHLGLDPLYDEVKQRVSDMNAYLDADSLRRQANTVVRLTVVTIMGLIGTITTGFLGMNLIAAADEPLTIKTVYFAVTLLLTLGLTFYTMAKSKKLSDWLDALTDDRLSGWAKLKALAAVWRK